MTGRRVDPVERFWAKVNKTVGCWLWTASASPDGYGKFNPTHGRTWYAHRYSWELHYGPITDGLRVLHHCDVPACVRPEHLHLGTDADNAREKIERGRAVYRTGDDHWTRARPDSLLRGEQHPGWLGDSPQTVRLSAGRTKAGESACETCGATYLTRLSRVGEQRFCSRSCQTKAHAAQVRANIIASGAYVTTKTGTVLRAAKATCVQCGADFLVELSRLKRGNTRYCTKRCIGLANAAKRWGHA